MEDIEESSSQAYLQPPSQMAAQPIGTSAMSKPLFGGPKIGGASVIKPGKYQPKKFQMAMPDEKQSGIYGLKSNQEDDELVESMALDDNLGSQRKPLNANPSMSVLSGGPKMMVVQQKQLGPNIIKQKIKQNLEDRKADPGAYKRPPS